MTTIRIFARSRVMLRVPVSGFATGLCGVCGAVAQTPPVPQPPPQVLREAQQQQSNITQEQQARERWRRDAGAQGVRLSSQRPAQCPKPYEWQVDEITVDGMSAVSRDMLQPLIDQFQGKRLGCGDISELRNKIYDLYDKASLPLTLVLIDEKGLDNHLLRIQIQESRLEDYGICKNNKRRQKNSAFPLTPGKPFTLDALDQGVESVDQMTTFRAGPSYPQDPKVRAEIDCEHPQGSTVTIKPGSKEGFGLVTVQTFQPLPFFMTAGVDNLGGQSTGRSRVNASVGVEDVLGLYERFSVQGSHTTHFGNGDDRARNLSGEFTVPLGYARFSLSGNYFDYRSTIVVGGQSFVTMGDQSFYSADIDRVVGRNQREVWSVGGGLAIKDSNNFINGLKLATSSRKLTFVNVRASYRVVRLLGGSFAGTLGLAQGLKQFGALNDVSVTRAQPHAQFTQVSLALNYGRSFGFGPLDADSEPRGGTLRFQSFVSASYAPHALYGTEKVQIGGPFTVRGFDDTSLSGDVGGFTRNELVFYPYMRASKFLGRLAFFGALDAGVIVRDYADRSVEKALAGIAGGVRLNGNNFRSEVRLEKAIAAPALFTRRRAIFRFNVAFSI